MPKTLIGADVGGTKTAVGVSVDGQIVGRAEGPGAAGRPGRPLASASTIVEVVRRALSTAGKMTGDALVVGAAGAGRELGRGGVGNAPRGGKLGAPTPGA